MTPHFDTRLDEYDVWTCKGETMVEECFQKLRLYYAEMWHVVIKCTKHQQGATTAHNQWVEIVWQNWEKLETELKIVFFMKEKLHAFLCIKDALKTVRKRVYGWQVSCVPVLFEKELNLW